MHIKRLIFICAGYVEIGKYILIKCKCESVVNIISITSHENRNVILNIP